MRRLLPILFATSALCAQELSPKEVEAFLSRLSEARGGTAVQANFREERRLALMTKPIVETGKVAFLPPDKFRREVDGGSLTVCDGNVLWLYYPQFGEVEKYTLSSNRSVRESVAAMTSGFGLQNLSKNYSLRISKTADGYIAKLTPKISSLRKAVAEIEVDIASDLSVRRVEILGSEGDRTLITFSNERRANLSSEDFRFRPPKGVRVSEPLE